METILKSLGEEKDWIISLRRELHQYPELGGEEFRTAERIEAELDRLEIPHVRVGETGVLGRLRGLGPGEKTVVLRADMDALPIQETTGAEYSSRRPGVMHACGHDAHTACLLGAARLLSRRRAEFGGEVRFIFQPAEEIGRGAKPFVECGALEGACRVFGLHTAPDLRSGTVGLKPGINNASVDHLKITVQGRAAHVSAPQLGVDALYIASQLVVALQALVTRRTSPVEPVILGVGTLHAGTGYNVLAERAELEGTLRTVSMETREKTKTEVSEAAAHIAAIYGGTAEVVWTDYAAPLLNDPAVCLEAAEIAEGLLGPGSVVTDRKLSLAGDNFSEFLLHVPGAYAYLGTGNPRLPNTVISNHNGSFDIDEAALPTGAGLYAGYALAALG